MWERSALRSSTSEAAPAPLFVTVKFTWPAWTVDGVGWQPLLVSVMATS